MHKTIIEPVYLDTIVYQGSKGAKTPIEDGTDKQKEFSFHLNFASQNGTTRLYYTLSIFIFIFTIDITYDTSRSVGILGSLSLDFDLVEQCETYAKNIEEFPWINSNLVLNPNKDNVLTDITEMSRFHEIICAENNTIQKLTNKQLPRKEFIRWKPARLYINNLQSILFHSLKCNNSKSITTGHSKMNFMFSSLHMCNKLQEKLRNQQKMKYAIVSLLILTWFAIAVLCPYLSHMFLREAVKSSKYLQNICDEIDRTFTVIKQEKQQSKNLFCIKCYLILSLINLLLVNRWKLKPLKK